MNGTDVRDERLGELLVVRFAISPRSPRAVPSIGTAGLARSASSRP